MKKIFPLAVLGVLALSGCGSDSHTANIGAGTAQIPPPINPLAAVDEAKLLSSAEAKEWLVAKESFGPSYAGSAKYDQFIGFLEGKMRSYGMVDFTRYTFSYPFWSTSEWPDKSGWSLKSDGTNIEVASYAVNSGNTGPAGVTGTMILYDLNLPAAQRPTNAQMAGKIVVIKQAIYNATTASADSGYSGSGYSGYQFRSDPATFPTAVGVAVPASVDANFRNRSQLSNSTLGKTVCQAAGAIGAIWVLDMSPTAAAGARQHSTPDQYNCPGVLLDRNAGVKVVADATAAKTATVVLNSKTVNTRPAQIVAYLPGKDFGKANDQKLLMITHTDGPSIVEDNGALGILAVVKYFSQIPQAQRPRTLMVYLDNRHFVAGAEASYPFDYFEDFPDAAKGLVGGLAMEHFGGAQFNELGDAYTATGMPAHTNLFSFPNPLAVETAIAVVKEVNLRRANVATPTAVGLGSVYSDTGVDGQSQGFWYGPGFMSPFVNNGRLPAFHVSGDWPSAGYQAYYPSVDTRVDPEYFRTMVRTSLRLLSTLSTSDLTKLAPDWGIVLANIKSLTPANFNAGLDGTALRTAWIAQFTTAFNAVRAGDYATAKNQMSTLRAAMAASLTSTAAANPLANVDRTIALATKGAQLPNP